MAKLITVELTLKKLLDNSQYGCFFIQDKKIILYSHEYGWFEFADINDNDSQMFYERLVLAKRKKRNRYISSFFDLNLKVIKRHTIM